MRPDSRKRMSLPSYLPEDKWPEIELLELEWESSYNYDNSTLTSNEQPKGIAKPISVCTTKPQVYHSLHANFMPALEAWMQGYTFEPNTIAVHLSYTLCYMIHKGKYQYLTLNSQIEFQWQHSWMLALFLDHYIRAGMRYITLAELHYQLLAAMVSSLQARASYL